MRSLHHQTKYKHSCPSTFFSYQLPISQCTNLCLDSFPLQDSNAFWHRTLSSTEHCALGGNHLRCSPHAVTSQALTKAWVTEHCYQLSLSCQGQKSFINCVSHGLYMAGQSLALGILQQTSWKLSWVQKKVQFTETKTTREQTRCHKIYISQACPTGLREPGQKHKD